MLWTILVILVVLWSLGLVTSTTMGGLVHVLVVAAVIIPIVQLVSGRRVLEPDLLTNLRLQGAIHNDLRRFLDSLARRTASTTSLPHLARSPNLSASCTFRFEPW